ncbi:MAG: EcsC family protein [Paracoccus sp. (in: a-proteobacteria)]|uniref:EcsC family protein n=1 Tax=Paracoccus sp. TaxID=267 RepID=UPI0026DF513C|nr:EcsC family protein [Paracoccus sp. (in: a-proteobacteria)]MDO5620078.1 EcsC family protein [Paracoccus sp. (in: a-proteobacteria)]
MPRSTMPAKGQAVLPPITDPTVHAAIDRLARRYLRAGGIGMEIMNMVGGSAESALKRLPSFVTRRLDKIVTLGLERAYDAADRSRRVVRDRGDWFNRLATTASGVAGGVAGLPGAVVELPVTITLLLRAMLEIAAEHGFDPDSDEVRRECLLIFAAGGPGTEDDGTDVGLLAARLTITGQTLQGLIAKVAPRLSATLAQKLAAQAAPVLGAVAGASINYTFAAYYQQLARVHFGMMRLADEADLPREAVAEAVRLRIAQLRD